MNDAELLKHLAINANCSDQDPELFFEPEDSRNMVKALLPMLKKLCDGCVVKDKCLDYALRNDVEGVWGGTSHAERKRMRKELGLKAEPVNLMQWVSRLRTIDHEVALYEYIRKNPVCKRGHAVKEEYDILISYPKDRTSGTPEFMCRMCNRYLSNKHNHKRASALSTEPSRG
jgi:WhiB family redox-sensing transcriptional regulator